MSFIKLFIKVASLKILIVFLFEEFLFDFLLLRWLWFGVWFNTDFIIELFSGIYKFALFPT